MVEQIFNDKNARLLRALYKEIFYNLEVSPPPTGQDIQDAKDYMVQRITTILGYQGIYAAPGSGLHRAVTDFCNNKVNELATGAKQARIKREDKTYYNQKRQSGLGKTYDVTAGGILGGFARKVGHDARTVMFSIAIMVVGIIIAAYVSNLWYLWGFICLAVYMLLPNPQETKMVDTTEYKFGFGSMAAKGNGVNLGVSFLKAFLRIVFIICFVFGLYSQPFPMSNLILLFLCFGFYFSLPIEFTPKMPYEFMLSVCRLLLGLFIGLFVFGLSAGSGIFQAPELGWITIAFFCVFPVATEKENIARAIGFLGAGNGESHEMIDKIIFIVIMIGWGINYGFNLLGGTTTGILFGTAGMVFGAVWIIGAIAGLTTPAETRPWMGSIVLIVGFVVFGMGVGQQAMGVALFGEWWPTLHNTATDFLKPVGDMFGQFQTTFGQSWLLFTNPVGYAQQITQGTYATNDLGVKGAYGLELRKFDVQSIYINEPFAIQIELENKGIFKARNVYIEILTNIANQSTSLFTIGKDTTSMTMMQPAYKDEYGKQWYKTTICASGCNIANSALTNIDRQDALPIFLLGEVSCTAFDETAWKDFKGKMGFGIAGPEGQNHTVRQQFIPFVINVTYDYEATSNLQVDFISVDEWKRLSAENKLTRGPKASLISTSPASLNLGSMDQPIREDAPFYVGFNLSTTWPGKTMITDSKVNLLLPKDFGAITCTGSSTPGTHTPDYWNYTYDLTRSSSKSAFCNYNGLKSPPTTTLGVPKKTYTVMAYASYKFSKWDSKDTQFNFNDVCWTTKIP